MRILHFKIITLIALSAAASIALADPSGRVGRLSYTQGDVSFRSNADESATSAHVNWPITSQNIITNGRNARSEMRVGSAAVRIDADSELEVTQLDDEHVDLRLNYGSAYVRIKNPELAREFTLSTQQMRVSLSGPSRLRIDADLAPETTTLNVLDGAARVANQESTFNVRAGKRADINNGDIRMSTLRPNDLQDDFDSWAASRDQRDDQSQTVRYVSPETTGYEDLDQYGSWQTTTEYGAVWYPRSAAADWAPYRTGRWTWVEPWGWTWVDSAPWGYAPFHYGRWVQFHDRWCWAPGTVVARPVWAPAMVGWVGGSNWSVSFSSGSAPAVGWFPLAPREVYVPSYRVSQHYIQQVNITHVTNVTNVTVVNGFATAPQNIRYQNREVRNAISLMPHADFVSKRTVVVSAPERNNHRRQLNDAPVSAVMPATITHRNDFNRPTDRIISAPQEQQNRSRQNDFGRPADHSINPQPAQQGRDPRPEVRESAPPTVRLPAPQERNNPGLIRNSDNRTDRQPLSVTPPTIQMSPQQPSRETPRAVPQPNQAQELERERGRREHDAQQQAEAQARALREQQRSQQQQQQIPLKQVAPQNPNPPQEERMRHWQEKPQAEIRRESPPAATKELKEPKEQKDPKESDHRSDRRDK